MKFADPKNDLAFKKIFGNENHKNILISFLNSVLDFKDDKIIVDVSLANPYQIPKIPELKETILGISATNKANEKFIVEMQKKDLGNFTKRSLYYTSKAYVSQLPKGNNYTILKKVYFIGIVNFEIFNNKDFVSRHLILNKETLSNGLDDFVFTFIELPKFNKDLEQLDSILDKWIYFIKYANDLTLMPEQYKSIEEFREAFEIASQSTWNAKELEIYEYMGLKEFDEINALRTAKEKGMKQGIDKGIDKGIEKGMEKGMKKGEENKAIEIAKNLLDVLDDETISLKTKLDINVIKDLK